MICEEEVESNDGNVLDLSMRGWRTLDESLLKRAARRVQLEHNELVSLPSCIGTLTLMTKLDVSNNVLECLPAELGHCRRLVTLVCANNHLRELPMELGRCKHLEELRANDNRLTTIPASLGSLEMLRVIELRRNRLESLPYEIGGLESLTTLDCAFNDDFDAVPAQIRDDPVMVDFTMKLHFQTTRHYLAMNADYHRLLATLQEKEEANMRLRDAIDHLKADKTSVLSKKAASLCKLM